MTKSNCTQCDKSLTFTLHPLTRATEDQVRQRSNLTVRTANSGYNKATKQQSFGHVIKKHIQNKCLMETCANKLISLIRTSGSAFFFQTDLRH